MTRPEFRLRSLLVICSSAVALMLAEGMVRVFAPQMVSIPLQDELDGVLAPRPNVSGRIAMPGTFDTTASYNSQRFRGRREYTVRPPAGAIRIAALGDSLTFGFGANDDETYPARLEEELSKLLKKVEVINASNSGSGTGDQALYYDRWVSQFAPQLVLLNVHWNDVDDDFDRQLFVLDPGGAVHPRKPETIKAVDHTLRSWRSMVNSLPGYMFFSQHSQLLTLVRGVGTQVLLRRRETALNANSGGQDTEAWEPRFKAEGLPIMAGEVRWLNGRVRMSGRALIVVFLPPQWWVAGAESEWQRKSQMMVQNLKETCAGEGIPFLDVTAAVQRKEAELGASLYFQQRDHHPNPRGYRAFAEIIAMFVMNCLPQKGKPS